MSKNIRTQIGKVIGKTLNSYHARVKPVIDDIKFKILKICNYVIGKFCKGE